MEMVFSREEIFELMTQGLDEPKKSSLLRILERSSNEELSKSLINQLKRNDTDEALIPDKLIIYDQSDLEKKVNSATEENDQ